MNLNQVTLPRGALPLNGVGRMRVRRSSGSWINSEVTASAALLLVVRLDRFVTPHPNPSPGGEGLGSAVFVASESMLPRSIIRPRLGA